MSKSIGTLPSSNELTEHRRTLSNGDVRQYHYKLFRVPGPDGKDTTVSMLPNEYIALYSAYGQDEKSFAALVREVARDLLAGGGPRAGNTFTGQVLELVRQRVSGGS